MFMSSSSNKALDLINNPFAHAKRLYRLSPLAGKNRIQRLKRREVRAPVISAPTRTVFVDDRRRPRSGDYYNYY